MLLKGALFLSLLPAVLCSGGSCAASSASESSSSSSSCSSSPFWDPLHNGFFASTVFTSSTISKKLPPAFDPFYTALELPLLLANFSIDPSLCDSLQEFVLAIDSEPAEELVPGMSVEDLEEANLLVAMTTQRYLHCQLVKKEKRVVPNNVGRLHVDLSRRLDRKPSLSYIHLVLNNCWKRSAHAAGDVFVQAPEFEMRYLISGLKGERGFYLAHCEVEAIAIPVVKAGMTISNEVCNLPASEEALKGIDVKGLVANLNTMADSIRLMVVSLKRMFRYVTPKEFLYLVRPWFEFDEMRSPKGVTFEGLFDEAPQFFPGPTGAMTSSLPFIDSILSIKLQDPTLNHLMSDFREYWPKKHQELIDGIDACPLSVKKLLSDETYSSLLSKEVWDELSTAFDDALTAMGELRAAHVLHTETFILSQLPPQVQKNMIGTGGSPFTKYLCTHTLDTINSRVRKDSPSVAVPHSCFQGISLSQVIASVQAGEVKH